MSCLIGLGDSFVITGGKESPHKVTQYIQDGRLNELPELNVGRTSHGCSSYVDSNKNIVSRYLHQKILIGLIN